VERIAEITARRHGAVVRRDAVLGRGLPKARAVVAGRRTRVEVQLAAAWGRPLDEVATEVRQAITEDIERFTALGVDRVDVEITAVEITAVEITAVDLTAPSTAPASAPPASAPPASAPPASAPPASAPPASAPLASAAPASADPVRGDLARVGAGRERDRPVSARRPVARPAAGVVGVLVALVLIVVGAVGVAEMLRAVGLLRGEVIRPGWFGWTAVLEPTSWLRTAGIAAVVVGLLLLVIVVKPRRRTHLAVQGPDTMVWIAAADAARLAAESATALDSVTAASVTAKHRRLDATITTFGDPERVRDEVRTSIAERLHTVSPQPHLRIELRED
jgi:hypothetical protein